ncbi:hypothetical protein [Kitasatospora sp. NPDC050543]|uniref:hypothetical protein n=1 Tax=Kitasatospora sp. NPDC050543 TaxID=3364054 RepID=UPI0037961E65
MPHAGRAAVVMRLPVMARGVVRVILRVIVRGVVRVIAAAVRIGVRIGVRVDLHRPYRGTSTPLQPLPFYGL